VQNKGSTTWLQKTVQSGPSRFVLLANITHINKSKRMRSVRYGVHMMERRGTYGALVGKPEGKRPLARTRHRWADNINLDLKEI